MNNFWNSVFGAETPTVIYCEVAQSGLIARPGYFVSNFAYILVGIYLLTKTNKLGKTLGTISIAIGIFSGIYDASFKFNAQILDLLAMFSLVNFLFVLNVYKLELLSKAQSVVLAVGLQTAYFLSITLLVGQSGRVLFGILVVAVIASEIWLLRQSTNYQHKYFLLALATFIGGYLIWMLDATQVWCAPIEYLNGRAIYHYITAVTIYYLYRHNLQKVK